MWSCSLCSYYPVSVVTMPMSASMWTLLLLLLTLHLQTHHTKNFLVFVALISTLYRRSQWTLQCGTWRSHSWPWTWTWSWSKLWLWLMWCWGLRQGNWRGGLGLVVWLKTCFWKLNSIQAVYEKITDLIQKIVLLWFSIKCPDAIRF